MNNRLLELGLPGDTFNLYLDKSKSSDQDPTIIFLDYNPLTDIPTGHPTETRVRIEIGVRGMMEPTEQRPISSLLSEYLGKEEKFGVRSVLPQRTFWEKVFLIHELFQKEIDKIDVSRMSRHWYDLHSLNLAGFGEQAMADKVLFEAIRGHRGVFTKVSGIDYETLMANSFNLFPPNTLQEDWSQDYDSMMESYIYQDAPTMQELAKGIETIVANLKALSF